MKQPSNARQIQLDVIRVPAEVRCMNCHKVVSSDGKTLVVHLATPEGCICHTCARVQNFQNQPMKLDNEREN